MPLPLLRIPLLPLIDIVKDLDIIDLVNLLQLSTRAKNLVSLTKKHIKLTVFRDRFQFEMINDPEKKMEVYFTHRNASTPNERMLPLKPIFNQSSKTRLEHTVEEYKRMMNNIRHIFIVETVSFELNNATFHSAYCFLEYARRVGLKFGHVEIELLKEKNGDYQKLLAVCSDAFELFVNVDQRKSFTFDGFDQFKMDRCLIRGSNYINWFTVDHMCALVSCSQVTVFDINWISKDLNKFLKFWIESDGRLTWLKLANRRTLSPRIVMDGIDKRVIVPNEVFEVQRADGVRAKVIFFELDKMFRLEVINV